MTRRGVRTILMAVRDAEAVPPALLAKTAALAPAGARIELFHALSGPVSIAISGTRQSRATVSNAMRNAEDRAVGVLQRVGRSRLLQSHRVTVHVTWDYPAADAIVRRARALRADLIVAGVQPHQFAGRLLLMNTDWELIREAPCPLLLARPTGRYRGAAVVAATDPFHANDKPARLDGRLLEAARAVAREIGGEAHAFHAYVPLAALMAATLMQPMPLPITNEEEAVYARSVRRRFDAVAARGRIPPARRHLRGGDVPTQLADVVRRTHAEIVVMGALSRSGLKRLFIGNTAERVLDRLPCDLLVVKPTTFRSRVPRRAATRPSSPLPAFPAFPT